MNTLFVKTYELVVASAKAKAAVQRPAPVVVAALFTEQPEVSRGPWVDLSLLHPLAAAGGPVLQRVAWWLESLCWQSGLCGSG